jgi:hypothetical protein
MKEFNARELASVTWFDCWEKIIKVKAHQFLWQKKKNNKFLKFKVEFRYVTGSEGLFGEQNCDERALPTTKHSLQKLQLLGLKLQFPDITKQGESNNSSL